MKDYSHVHKFTKRQGKITRKSLILLLLLTTMMIATVIITAQQTTQSTPQQNTNHGNPTREGAPQAGNWWAAAYGGSSSDIVYSAQQTADGGYILAGFTRSFGSGGQDAWLLKLNSTGGIAWQKTYGDGGDEVAWCVQQTSDGGYVVGAGRAPSGAGSYDAWVLKLNSTGGVTWQNAYGGPNNDEAYAVLQTFDGGYIVAGYTNSFGVGGGYADAWVFKLDSTGGVTWQETFGGGLNDWALSVRQTADEGYIVAGYTESIGAGHYDYWVIRLSSTGVLTWQRTYGYTGDDLAECIQRTSDGGYIVAGATASFGAGSIDFWVLKLDSSGGVTWQKAYGGSGNEWAYYVQQTSDGGYIVAGKTASFGAGLDDVWVVKLGVGGLIVWNGGSGASTHATTVASPSSSVAASITPITRTDSSAPPASTAVTPVNTNAAVSIQATTNPNIPFWAKTYGGSGSDNAYSVEQTADGGYIVAGSTTSFGVISGDVWVLKLDSGGSVAWQKTYGSTGDDRASSVKQTSDGGYIVAGQTTSFGTGDQDVWVLKLDSGGSVAWQKTYGSTGTDYARCVQQTMDGGYIVVGGTTSFGAGLDDVWVLKLTSGGGISWQKTYGGNRYDWALSVQQTSDGGYVVAGMSEYSYGRELWVFKLDGTGAVTWTNTYGDTSADEYATSIQQTSDGGYIVAGYRQSYGSGYYDVWVLKLTSAGGVTWQKADGWLSDVRPCSIQQTSDGGYIVAGYTNSFGAGGYDAWVLKLTSAGGVTWHKAYGGSGNDYAYSVEETADGGYIVGGYSASFGAGGSDVWVLKLGVSGDIPWDIDCGASTTSVGWVTIVTTAAPFYWPVPSVTSAATTKSTTVTPQNTDAVVTVQAPDATPPATITDLATSNPMTTSITLTWTAPGDSGMRGKAAGYILKYSTAGPITALNWGSATTYPQSFTPLPAGSVESHVVSSLNLGTTYWFAVEAYDRVPNYGGVSNSPSATTLCPPAPTIDQPSAITYLAGTTEHTITWHPSSQIPDHYTISVNGGSPISYSWSGSAITYNVDGLSVGTYTYNCTVYDIVGRIASSKVQVSVLPASAANYWANTYGGSGDDYAASVQQTSDGGYIVAGHTTSFGAGGYDVWVLRLDSAGSVTWQRTYGGSGDDYAYSVQQTSDGGYIVAGYTSSFGPPYYANAWVLKLYPDSSVAWQKAYGGTAFDYAYSVQQTSDGGYIVAGTTNSFGVAADDVWVLKLNSAGSVTWQKAYGDMLIEGEILPAYEGAYSVQQTSDGGYIVAGYSMYGIWVLKLNSAGSVTWQEILGDGRAYSVQQTSDGGYIVAGAGSSDAQVLHLNSAGSVTWQKTYGGSGNDWASLVRQTSDRCYIIAGCTSSFGAGGVDLWVIKLGVDGDIVWDASSGASTHTTTITPRYYTIATKTTSGTTTTGAATIKITTVTPQNTNATVTVQSPPPAPTIDQPSNLVYTIGQTGNGITWTPSSQIPSMYCITRNGTTVASGSWSGTPITQSVDGLTAGRYIYTCTVNDTRSRSISSSVQVLVFVVLPPAPTIDQPSNIIYTIGQTGNAITWHSSSEIPDHYTMSVNDGSPTSYSWDGSAITLSVDGLSVGTYTYNCTVYDTQGRSASSKVQVTVLPVNNAPAAMDDHYVLDEDTVLMVDALGVLANDTDVDGDQLAAELVSGPSYGTLTLQSDGSFTYTPNLNFNGQDVFVYEVSDGVLTDTGTVTITVLPVNDAPVAMDDHYVVDEDTVLSVGAPGVLANDSDVDGDLLEAVLVLEPSHGTATLNPDGSFMYTPDPNWNGMDSFIYEVSDGALTGTGTVTITVLPVDDWAVAVDDYAVTDEDTPIYIPVLANDYDVDGDAIRVMGYGWQPPQPHGSLQWVRVGGVLMMLYTPDPNFHGTAWFMYAIYVSSDESQGVDWATVTVTVNSVPDAPVAQGDTYALDEDTVLSVGAVGGVLANDADADGDLLVAELVSGPSHGTLILQSDGSFVYTPDPNFNGVDSFTYYATDGLLDSNIATVTITIAPVDDWAVAVDDYAVTDEDTPVYIAVLANDYDVDGDAIRVMGYGWQPPQPHGSLQSVRVGGVYMILYTPDPNFHGTVWFMYGIWVSLDESQGVDWARVTITVNSVPDAPVAMDDHYTVEAGKLSTIAAPGVLGNDIDVDGNILGAVLDVAPLHGSVTLFPDGSFSYTPDFGYVGEDAFTYHASDGALNSNVAVVTITVIDTTPPVTAVGLKGYLGTHGWYTSLVMVTLTAMDAHTFVATTCYRLDGATWNLYTGPFTVSTEGNSTISYYSTDIAGNVEDVKTQNVGIDVTPPITTIIVDPPWYSSWYGTESVVCQLYTREITSGFIGGSYRIDGGIWQTFTNGSTISITGEGPHELEYFATDLAGNVETVRLHPIGIDLSPPSVTYILSGIEGANEWWQTPVHITLVAADSLSGVEGVTYWVDEASYDAMTGGFEVLFDTEGIHTVRWQVWDHMPWFTAGSITVKVDLAPPVTHLSYVQIAGIGSVVTLTSTDSMSDEVSIAYSSDGATWIPYKTPFTLSVGGIVQVYFNATDKAGRVEPTQFESVEVDVQPPVTTIYPDGTLGLAGWYNSDVYVTMTAKDDLMGLEAIFYSYDGSTWDTYVTPLHIGFEGLTTIHYYAVDKVGNQEDPRELEIHIDKTPPSTTLDIQPPVYGTDPYYVSTATPFVLTAVDPVSGVDRIEYQIDTDGWMTYQIPFKIANPGAHWVSYRSIDIAGNIEPVQAVKVVVSATALTFNGEFIGVYSDPVSLHAQLIDLATQLPVPGKPIVFTVGSQSAVAVTGVDGEASVSIVLDQPAGGYAVSAAFTADGEYLASTDADAFTIKKETAYVTYTGSTVVPTTADTITLRATVLDDVDGYWGDLTKIYVTFRIYSVPLNPENPVLVAGPYQIEITGVDGVGIAIVKVPNLLENSYLVVIHFDPDDNSFYQGDPSDLMVIVVYEPSGDFVTGGGWIIDSNGDKGNFGFNVKYKANGLPKGQAIYIYRVGDWQYIVKSTAWLGMAIEGNHAFFEAKCVVQKYDTNTGELVWSEGNYNFRVDVWDNGGSGGSDVYQILIYDKNGLVYHEAGFSPYGCLQGGNIQIHLKKK